MNWYKHNIKASRNHLIAIIAIVSVVILSLVLFSGCIIGKVVSNKIYKESGCTYRFGYNSFSFNIFNGRIKVIEPLLLPVSPDIAVDSSTVAFTAKSIIIDKFRYFRFLYSHDIDISTLTINSPIVDFKGENSLSDKFKKDDSGTDQAVANSLENSISINKILINNANIDLNELIELPQDATMPRVNMELVGFKMGKGASKDTPFIFDVNDVFVKINDIKHELADGLHKIDTKEISLSLIKKEIKITDAKLISTSDSISEANTYNISVPTVKINSTNIKKLLYSDSLWIGVVEFEKPDINIHFGKSGGTEIKLNELDFFQLIKGELSFINIDSFAFTNANISFQTFGADTSNTFINNVDINFSGFEISPISYCDPARILSSESLALNIGELVINHADGIHRLVVDSINIDTELKTISSQQVIFCPIEKQVSDSNFTYINIRVDGLDLNGFSFFDAYRWQKFPMDELIIKNPAIDVRLSYRHEKVVERHDQSLLLQKMTPYISGVYVKKSNIKNGFLAYHFFNKREQNDEFKTNFSLSLNGLSLDSITFYKTDKIFFANDFNMSVSDVSFDLADQIHQLHTDSASLSSNGQSAVIFNLMITPYILNKRDSFLQRSNAELYDLRFPYITMSGAGFHRAFFEKTLEIKDFTMNQPHINIVKFGKWGNNNDSIPHSAQEKDGLYTLFSDFMERIKVDNLEIKDGKLDYSQHFSNGKGSDISNRFSVRLYNFEIDSMSHLRNNKLFYSDVVDISLKNQVFDLADGLHRLEAAEISMYTGQNKIQIRNAKLYPDMQSDLFKKTAMAFEAEIPVIQADGAKVAHFFSTGSIQVDQLLLKNPKCKMYVQSKVLNADSSHKPMLVPKRITDLHIKNFIVDNGDVKIETSSEMSDIAHAKVNFSMYDLNAFNEKGKMSVNYNDFKIDMDDMRFYLSNKQHTLTISHTSYHNASKKLSIDDFVLKPQQNTASSEVKIDAIIPKVEFNGFDMNKLIYEKELHVEDVAIFNPTIETFSNSKTVKNKFDIYGDSLYNHIGKHLKKLSVSKYVIDNADIKLAQNKPLNKVDINGFGLVIDGSPRNNANRLFCSDSLNISLDKITGETKNHYYKYAIEGLNIKSDGSFSITKASFNPAFKHKEFMIKKRFQDDYWNIGISEISGKNLDMEALCYNKTFDIDILNVNIDSACDFRDKRIPINPERYVKLPQKMLRDLDFNLNINTLNVACSNLIYREFNTNATSEGKINFTKMTATVNNVTNIKSRIERNNIMHSKFNGLLMGSGEVEITADFNLSSEQNMFEVEASCGHFNLEELNPIIGPSMRATIDKGVCNKLQVQFTANEDTSSGKMFFAYDELKLSILKIKRGTLKKDGLVSFFANNIVIKDKNPSSDKNIETVDFTNVRDKQRSVANYVWKSIFAGMKKTFGIDK